METITSIKNFPGRKWLESASYISDDVRERTYAAVREAREESAEKVSVRPASYIGPDSALVTVSTGGRIFRMIHR